MPSFPCLATRHPALPGRGHMLKSMRRRRLSGGFASFKLQQLATGQVDRIRTIYAKQGGTRRPYPHGSRSATVARVLNANGENLQVTGGPPSTKHRMQAFLMPIDRLQSIFQGHRGTRFGQLVNLPSNKQANERGIPRRSGQINARCWVPCLAAITTCYATRLQAVIVLARWIAVLITSRTSSDKTTERRRTIPRG